MDQEITILQLIKLSIEQLSSIDIPVSQMEQIAMPILRVINNLKIGVKAIEEAEKEKNEDAPQLELVPVEEPTTNEEE